MRTNNIVAAEHSGAAPRPRLIASWKHLVGFLLIGVAIVALGLLAQRAPAAAGAPAGQLGRHSQAIPIYLSVILMEWALLYYCWVGVHRRGGNLETLSGGRWTSWKSVATDMTIAVPFWLAWEGAECAVNRLLGPNSAKSLNSLLPHSPLEILIWIATSITAGICEEMAFRGYLQRQLHALTGSVVMAVLAQGVVFGLFHFYQGWKNVLVISVLGILFGALAAWRGNLRANIIVHAWGDIWSGWLKTAVWR
jgi:uncharacterized protein